MRIAQFLQDRDGNLSSTRLAFLLWMIGIFATWVLICIRANELKEIPESVLAMVGLLTTGKVVQSFGEKPPAS